MDKNLKVLCVFDSFKGSMSSEQLGKYSKQVLNEMNIECDYLSIADGGEGTNEVLKALLNLKTRNITVHDLNLELTETSYLYNETTAFIESANVIGLGLKHNDIKECSSYGIGEMINDGFNSGIRNFVLSLGGTGTSDAGLGILEALGLKLNYGENKRHLNPILNLSSFNEENLEKYKECTFTVLSDVTNPFVGDKGANHIFAKQKGATAEDIELLEKGFVKLNQLCNKQLNNIVGGGAAGGISASLCYFLGARITSGIDTLLDFYKFEDIAKKYDLIITGEGSFDSQSLDGKVISGICNRVKTTPILVLAGAVEPSIDKNKLSNNIVYFSIQTKPCSLSEALEIEQTKSNLKTTLTNLITLFMFNK